MIMRDHYDYDSDCSRVKCDTKLDLDTGESESVQIVSTRLPNGISDYYVALATARSQTT